MVDLPRLKKIFILSGCSLISALSATVILLGLIFTSSFPPNELKISNITENSLSISWISQKSVRQKVYYSAKPLNPLSLLLVQILPLKINSTSDDFGSISSTVHHVTLKNLEPETQYYFAIANGFRFYKADKLNTPLPPIKTASSLKNPPSLYPCYGTILDFANEMPKDPIIVYLSSSDSSLISIFTNSAGNYSLDLANLRTKDLKEIYNFSQNPNLILETQGGLWGAKSQPLYIKNCQPVKTIVLE